MYAPGSHVGGFGVPVDNVTGMTVADYKWLPARLHRVFQQALEVEDGLARAYFLAEIELAVALRSRVRGSEEDHREAVGSSPNSEHPAQNDSLRSQRRSEDARSVQEILERVKRLEEGLSDLEKSKRALQSHVRLPHSCPTPSAQDQTEVISSVPCVLLVTWDALYIVTDEAAILGCVLWRDVAQISVVSSEWTWLRLLPSRAPGHVHGEDDVVFRLTRNNVSSSVSHHVLLGSLSAILVRHANILGNSRRAGYAGNDARTASADIISEFDSFGYLLLPHCTDTTHTNPTRRQFENSEEESLHFRERITSKWGVRLQQSQRETATAGSSGAPLRIPLIPYNSMWTEVSNPQLLIEHLYLRHQLLVVRPPAAPFDITAQPSMRWKSGVPTSSDNVVLRKRVQYEQNRPLVEQYNEEHRRHSLQDHNRDVFAVDVGESPSGTAHRYPVSPRMTTPRATEEQRMVPRGTGASPVTPPTRQQPVQARQRTQPGDDRRDADFPSFHAAGGAWRHNAVGDGEFSPWSISRSSAAASLHPLASSTEPRVVTPSKHTAQKPKAHKQWERRPPHSHSRSSSSGSSSTSLTAPSRKREVNSKHVQKVNTKPERKLTKPAHVATGETSVSVSSESDCSVASTSVTPRKCHEETSLPMNGSDAHEVALQAKERRDHPRQHPQERTIAADPERSDQTTPRNRKEDDSTATSLLYPTSMIDSTVLSSPSPAPALPRRTNERASKRDDNVVETPRDAEEKRRVRKENVRNTEGVVGSGNPLLERFHDQMAAAYAARWAPPTTTRPSQQTTPPARHMIRQRNDDHIMDDEEESPAPPAAVPRVHTASLEDNTAHDRDSKNHKVEWSSRYAGMLQPQRSPQLGKHKDETRVERRRDHSLGVVNANSYAYDIKREILSTDPEFSIPSKTQIPDIMQRSSRTHRRDAGEKKSRRQQDVGSTRQTHAAPQDALPSDGSDGEVGRVEDNAYPRGDGYDGDGGRTARSAAESGSSAIQVLRRFRTPSTGRSYDPDSHQSREGIPKREGKGDTASDHARKHRATSKQKERHRSRRPESSDSRTHRIDPNCWRKDNNSPSRHPSPRNTKDHKYTLQPSKVLPTNSRNNGFGETPRRRTESDRQQFSYSPPFIM